MLELLIKELFWIVWGSYVSNLVKIFLVWSHLETFQRLMKLLELLLEFSMIKDIPEWCLCPWWQFWLSPCALRKLCLKIGWNLLSLKASRTISKIDDITWVVADDNGHSWLGLVSLMTFWIVSICSEEAMFKIWFKSVEFKGIKNPFKD